MAPLLIIFLEVGGNRRWILGQQLPRTTRNTRMLFSLDLIGEVEAAYYTPVTLFQPLVTS